ncbi:MAG: hemagglutinin repeat-containing protein [Alphaproteobacteria bacterium]|nr:hemagglutinin repeat-containing protein [Alphaproteobacteria bacterium]
MLLTPTASAAMVAGHDITMDAHDDINILSSQLQAGHDVILNSDNNINLLALDADNSYAESHKMTSIGVTVAIQEGFTGLIDSVKGLGDKGSGSYAGIQTAADAFKGASQFASMYKASKGFTDPSQLLPSISLSLGISSSSSKYETSGSNFTQTQITAGHDFISHSGKDTTVKGANILAQNVNMDVDGDLNVESVQNTQETSKSEHSGGMSVGISYGVNGLSPTFGANAYSGSGDGHRKWTDNVTSIISTNSVDIDVTGKTTLTGAMIAQATPQEDGTYTDGGNLTLNTGSLEVSDLTDEDIWHYDGAGIAVGFGGPPGQPVFGSGSNLSSSYTPSLKIEDDTKIGVTHATIGAGIITIAGQAATDDQLNGVNRDVNKVQEILVDEHDHLDIEIPLSGLKSISEMISDIASKIGAASSQGVTLGALASLDQKLAQQGVSAEERNALLSTPEGQHLANVEYGMEVLKAIYGNDIPIEFIQAINAGILPVQTEAGLRWFPADQIANHDPNLLGGVGPTIKVSSSSLPALTSEQIISEYYATPQASDGLLAAGQLATSVLNDINYLQEHCNCLGAINAAVVIGIPTVMGAIAGGPIGAAIGLLEGGSSLTIQTIIMDSPVGKSVNDVITSAIKSSAEYYVSQGLSPEDAYSLGTISVLSTVMAAPAALGITTKAVLEVAGTNLVKTSVISEIEGTVGKGVNGLAKDVLVNADNAVIDKNKITGYALNPEHPVGGNKATVFESALGYNQSNADNLILQVKEGVKNYPATLGNADEFGQRFTVDMPITGPNGKTATVRTGWIYDTGSNIPRLTTIFVK